MAPKAKPKPAPKPDKLADLEARIVVLETKLGIVPPNG